MLNKFLFLTIFFFILSMQGYARQTIQVDFDRQPEEMAILKLPNHDYANWKEISRSVTDTAGIVELIPMNQQISNWSDLIRFQYFDRSFGKIKVTDSIEMILDLLKETTLTVHPDNRVSWKIIEKNKSDIIFEWILHKQHGQVPPQHEISRIFLTEKRVHSVVFCHQHTEMSSEEREKWIKLLKDSTSIATLDEAIGATTSLSIADKIRDSLDLGSAFQNWQSMTKFAFDTGYALVGRIPPTQPATHKDQSYITEAMEVTTMPNSDATSIDKWFKIEMHNVQKKSVGKIAFNVLKQSPTEIIYYYSRPKDHLQHTSVVRSFISDQGYYSIDYRRGLPEKMKQEDILKWKEKLEAIQVRSHMEASPSTQN